VIERIASRPPSSRRWERICSSQNRSSSRWGEHVVAHLSGELVRRAVEIDARFGDLDLGFVDAAVMAVAERLDLPILTFDVGHFRAAPPARGHWRLVVDEDAYRAAVSR